MAIDDGWHLPGHDKTLHDNVPPTPLREKQQNSSTLKKRTPHLETTGIAELPATQSTTHGISWHLNPHKLPTIFSVHATSHVNDAVSYSKRGDRIRGGGLLYTKPTPSAHERFLVSLRSTISTETNKLREHTNPLAHEDAHTSSRHSLWTRPVNPTSKVARMQRVS